jgi:hypothetical protein
MSENAYKPKFELSDKELLNYAVENGILSSPAFLKIAETLENTTRRRSLWCQKILHHTSKV